MPVLEPQYVMVRVDGEVVWGILLEFALVGSVRCQIPYQQNHAMATNVRSFSCDVYILYCELCIYYSLM